MCLVYKYVQCVEVLENNDLRWIYDVEVVFKHTHLEYGVFFFKLFIFYSHFIKFIFTFCNPSIFISTHPKNQYFCRDMSLDLSIWSKQVQKIC